MKSVEKTIQLEACLYLIALMPEKSDSIYSYRQAIYRLAKKILPKKINPQLETCLKASEIWKEADKIILKNITLSISECNDLLNFTNSYNFHNTDESVEWLNKFISFLSNNDFKNLLELSKNPILPNQSGIFTAKEKLLLDSIENSSCDGEELKDISQLLDYDVRQELLDQRIYLKLSENLNFKLSDIAHKIYENIKDSLSPLTPRTELMNEVCHRLFTWMNKHNSLAKDIFSSLYDIKHRLISDDEIVDSLEKAKQLEKLALDVGFSIEELSDWVKKSLEAEIEGKFINGVSALVTASNFSSEIGSSDRKIRAAINDDAQRLVFTELKKRGYNLPENIQADSTLVEGVTDPTGKQIQLIIKSAKQGFIYFSPYEWTILSKEEVQLFIVSEGNRVLNITLDSILFCNQNFQIDLKPENISISNLKAYTELLSELKDSKLIFKVPELNNEKRN